MSKNIRCPACGASWPENPEINYCGSCGRRLIEDAPPASDNRQSVTSPSLSGDPARSGQSVSSGGEQRYETVLFADIKGFTSFAEGKDPEVVAQVVGNFLEELAGAIEEAGGRVDKFIGDAVMAIFGVKRAPSEAAQIAVETGFRLQAIADQFSSDRGYDFPIRVGIHAGDVMRVFIGNNFTVMGDTVNTAERIEEKAPEGGVLVSEPVLKNLNRQWTSTKIDEVTFKGKSSPTALYQVEPEEKK